MKTSILPRVIAAVITTAAISANATTIEFPFTSGYSDQQKVGTVTNGPVTLSFGKGESNVAPTWLVSTSNLRIYAKNTITISSTQPITKVTITFSETARNFTNGTKAAATPSSGTYSENDATGTWIPGNNTAMVTITAGGTSGHARVNAIAVDVEGESQTVVNPVITPANTKFADEQTVTITCDDSEAQIFYTLDGTTPSATSTLYNAPFTITQTTEVKAIATKGNAKSSVVSSLLTLVQGVESVAEYLATPDNTELLFKCPVVVTATNGDKHTFVCDDTGAMLIFGTTNQNYKQGEIIPAGFVGTKLAYAGESELSVYGPTAQFQPASGQAQELTPVELEPEDVNTTHFAEYAVLRNVSITANDGPMTSLTLTSESGEETIGFTSTFGVLPPSDLTIRYDITGIVGSHGNGINTVWQFLPLTYTPCGDSPIYGDVNGDGEVTVGDVSAIYNIILGLSDEYKDKADVNGDGEVTVGDVSAIYDIILGL